MTTSYEFPEEGAFDSAFGRVVSHTYSQLKALGIFENKKLVLGCTINGYEENGFIPRHKDHDLLSGRRVVVLSFNSPTIIRFYPDEGDRMPHSFLIPPRSMYVMQDEARYKWTHEICADDIEINGETIEKTQRYSILFFDPGPLSQDSLVQEL